LELYELVALQIKKVNTLHPLSPFLPYLGYRWVYLSVRYLMLCSISVLICELNFFVCPSTTCTYVKLKSLGRTLSSCVVFRLGSLRIAALGSLDELLLPRRIPI
jgi:hypothetical protein